ncbi:MAG TPA: peptidoglycan-binding protein [Thermoanaerobaculia bacterium]|nr:peptidoglycan-binding protein [Thermoanaerobaculia bacterium]
MAPTKPMLDGVELPQAQRIASQDEEVLAQHAVPALEGDFLQDLGRRAVRVTLTGMLTGPEAGEDLKGLREKFHAAAPVPFVSDIATATRVDKVLIEEMGVRELAGKTERFEYALSLREYTPPPAVTEEVPPVIPVPPVPETATLVVEVIVEGDPAFDFSRVRVTATGTVSRTLTNRVGNVWTETDFLSGQYTVEAVVDDPDPMTGSARAEVREGETTQVTITLRRGARIAEAFVIHFWFDKAFIEPCLRQVLARVAARSDAHPDEKVLIVGHTDLVGSDDYNQSLSERRARSVHAFLTFGRDRPGAVAEWNELRRTRPIGQITTVRDTWSTREYQYMLQDLGFYLGNIDEDHGLATTAAIRAFQGESGLTPSGAMDDGTWEKLVEAYLEQDSFALPEERFFRNARGACNGGVLKWLGCGEKDPVLNTEKAWRPNRRTEILFIKGDTLPPGDVPEPDTFDLPTAGVNGTSWCLGPRNRNLTRCPFTTRTAPPPVGKLLIRPAEPGKVQVSGTITFEDGTPVANAKYSLTAPDGEYLNTAADRTPPPEREELPDLEEKQADPAPNLPPRLKQKGRPIPNRADSQGVFRFQRETPEGVYILELQELTAPQVARSTEEAVGSGRGNVVCFRLDAAPAREALAAAPPAPAAGKGGVVQSAPAPATPAVPSFTPQNPVVVVKRSYTSPARVPITMTVTGRARGRSTLTRSGDTASVKLFRRRTGGAEFAFDAADQATVTASELNRSGGFILFAESDTPTGSVGGYHLTLTLASGAAATADITAVRVTLDIFTAREPSGTAPQAFPQPPTPAPAAGAAVDKWFKGGLVNVQDAAHTQERIGLRVQFVEPNDFVGTLELRQVTVAGNNVGAPANRARGFENATETPGEAAVANPHPIPVNGLGFTPESLFLEGVSPSAAQRDTGFQIGVQGSSTDGDRVALTVGVGVSITPASTLRGVLVKKAHTNLARQAITLRTTAAVPATRQGTLTMTAASGAIRLFTTVAGTTEITNTANNVFPGSQLNTGVQVFAEGISACTSLNDIQLVLALAAGAPPAGIPGSVRLTCVELTLDAGLRRTAPGVDPPLLPAADKGDPGRFIQVANPDQRHERAMLITRPPNPRTFLCELVLTPLSPVMQLFTDEVPSALQTPIATPDVIVSLLTVPNGARSFVQATAVSAAPRDTGFQLGIVGLDNDGDRVAMTAVDLALTNNTPPFDTVVRRVQIEGILNSDRASYDLGDLFLTQADSLFRARVDVPGVAAGTTVQVRLVSRRANGTLLENHDLDLSRTSGDRFASLPILAIPEAFPRAEITFRAPQNIEVVRCQAGGTLRLELRGALANTGSVRATVRGRVLEFCTFAIVGAAPAGNLATANRVMAQAGIEFRASALPAVDDASLLDVEQTDCPLTVGGDANREDEETALFALGRAACGANFIVYFVRSNSMGLRGCSAYPAGQPGATLADTATQYTLGHEIGHVLHLPHNGGTNNLMNSSTSGLPANPADVNLLATQCQLMYNSGFLVFRE